MHKITLTTYSPDQAANEAISQALGFVAPIPEDTLIWHFAPEGTYKNGGFRSRRAAKATAEAINSRGAFGGFGKYRIIAEVKS